MATLEELVIQLTAETSGLKAELNSATKATIDATSKMDKAIESFSNNTTKSLSVSQTAFATMAGFLGSEAVLGVIDLVKDAFGELFDKLKEGVADSAAQEQATQRLSYALAQSGKYSKEAVSSFTEFADTMEATTGAQDHVVLANLALLSSMTKLSNEGLQKAEKAALDLSASMGIDLDAAVRLVGKGIEGNTDAFKRYGIQVDEGTDKTSRLANIMKAIPAGAAENAFNTFSGAVKSLSNSLGNLFEAFGDTIVQNPVVNAMLKELSNIIRELTGTAQSASEALQKGIATAFLVILEVTKQVIGAVDDFIRIMTAGLQTILVPVYALVDGINYLKNAITGADNKDAFKDTQNAIMKVNDTLHGQSFLGDVTNGLDRVEQAGVNAFDKIGVAAKDTSGFKNQKEGIDDLTRAYQKMQSDILKSNAEGLAAQNNAVGAQSQYEIDQLTALHEAKIISETDYQTQLQALQDQQRLDQQTALDNANAQGLIKGQAYNDAQTQLQQNQSVEALKQLKKRKDDEDAYNKLKLQATADIFGNLAVLSQSGNSTLASIGKAAAIAQATVQGYLAIQNALAQVPYPLNIAAAASIGIATAANVAKIAGVGFANGTESVPGTGSGDSVPAYLTPGERVVPNAQNDQLSRFLDNQENGGGANKFEINVNVNVAPGTGITQQQAAIIAEGINDAIASGVARLAV